MTDEELSDYARELIAPRPPPLRHFFEPDGVLYDAPRQLAELERTDPLMFGAGMTVEDATWYLEQHSDPARARAAVEAIR